MILSDELKSFLMLTRVKTLTEAAEKLHLTQAALSIKLKKLEDELKCQLFLRSRSGLSLTSEGEKLKIIVLQMEQMQDGWMKDKIHGSLKIGVYSTIGRSLVLPLMNSFFIDHGDLHLTFHVKEMRELLLMIESSDIDICFLDHPMSKEGFINKFLGYEEYVWAVNKKNQKREMIFLNHDEEDLMSFRYFDLFKEPKSDLKRLYLDEIYSVIDGIKFGLGSSILPRHLIEDEKDIKIKDPHRKMLVPVYLCYQNRAFRSQVFDDLVGLIIQKIPKHLVQK